MLDDHFYQSAAKLYEPTMGTEVAAELLYSLVRFTRPRRLLEVGSGFTTLFLLRALADNVIDHHRELLRLGEPSRSDSIIVPEYYGTPYNPTLAAVDDLSSPHAARVKTVAETLGVATYLTFHEGRFADVLPTVVPQISPIDFAWLDCGNYVNYTAFLQLVWPFMNQDGGLLALHSTETSLEAQAFMRKLKLRQATTSFLDFEQIGLLEPHKFRQNSIGLFRMTRDLKDRLYTIHS